MRVVAIHYFQVVIASLDLGIRVIVTQDFHSAVAGLDLVIRLLEQEHPMGRCWIFYYCRQHVLPNLVREI